MKRSTRAEGLPRALLLLVAATDLAARLAVPASLLALGRGHGDAAIALGASVSALAVVRGELAGRATERVLSVVWGRLVAASTRHDAIRLGARGDVHRVATLMDAAGHTSHLYANVIPQAAANLAALLVTLVLVARWLGPTWLLVGAAAVMLAAPVVAVLQRRVRSAQERSMQRFAAASLDLEVLLDAALELRAHGVERRHAAMALEGIRAMAAAERQAKRLSVLIGLLPLGITLVAALLPLRSWLGDLAPEGALVHLTNAGVLGATALIVGTGLLQGLEGWSRARPFRRVLAAFEEPAAAASDGEEVLSLRDAVVELDGVSVRYEGAAVDTPHALATSWPPARGLALLGGNGAGKTTLALALMGLIAPTAGSIRWDDVDGRDLDWHKLRRRVVYVSQTPFVAANRSVAWHLRLLAAGAPSDDELRAAIARVGLPDVLAVPASELSGGERKRMHLARAALGSPELVILDEPEAGLDATARVWLTEYLAELAAHSRVLVIAHDAGIIPEGFLRAHCARGRRETSRAS